MGEKFAGVEGGTGVEVSAGWRWRWCGGVRLGGEAHDESESHFTMQTPACN